jgi:hypothetical protein
MHYPDMIDVTSSELEREATENTVRTFMDTPWLLRASSLAERGFVAAPAPEGGPWPEIDRTRIVTVLPAHGIQCCLAIPVEALDRPRTYRVRMTQQGMREFMRECASLNYLLVAEDDAPFLLLCTGRDYCIYAGAEPIVEKAMGLQRAVAERRFKDFAEDPLWPARDRAHFLKVLQLCREVSAQA